MANHVYAVTMGDSFISGEGGRWPQDGTGKKTAVYLKWEPAADKLDEEFTQVFAGSWEGTPDQQSWLRAAASSGRSIPSFYLPKTGKIYFLHGDTYLRCTLATHTVDEGFPKSIGSYWPGLKSVGFDSGIDAALWWDEKTVYLFKGDRYVRYNLETDKVDEGYPKTIGSYWNGFKEAGFGSGIDAIIRWDTEWAYAFKGDQYIRFHIPTDKVDQAPRKTTISWKAIAEVPANRVLTIFQAPDTPGLDHRVILQSYPSPVPAKNRRLVASIRRSSPSIDDVVVALPDHNDWTPSKRS